MERVQNKYRYIKWIVLVAALVAAYFILPKFFTYKNIINVTRQSAMIGLCAIGMSFVLIIGHIDLSTGGVMSLSAMISGMLMLKDMPVMLAILVGLAAGTAIGFISGYIVAKIRVPAFIATYVMGEIAEGIALFICKGSSIGGMSDEYIKLGTGKLLGLPYFTWILIMVAVIAALYLKYTRFGKKMYALGGNEQTVTLEGIDADRIKCITFAMAGFCFALAGILLSAQMNTVTPTQGANYQLDAVAASVIGGVSLLGGEGKIWSAVLGGLMIGAMRNIINLLGVHPFVQNLFVGAVIVIVVAYSMYNKHKALNASKAF